MIWVQVGDARVTAVPPSGSGDAYAAFTFSGNPVPNGVQVKFVVGKGQLDLGGGEMTETVKRLTEADIFEAIVPIDGVEIDSIGIIDDHIVRNAQGDLTTASVAKAAIVISKPITEDSITIVAYSTYDKLGTVDRLQAKQVELTISRGEGVFLAAVEQYEPISDVWTDVAPMTTGRAGLCCATIGTNIYAIGGFNSDFTGANEEYDSVGDEWASMAPLANPRGFSCAVAYAGEVYVIGGFKFTPGGAMTNFDKYDPVLDTWTALADLPAPVAFATAQVVGTKIYVMFGGSNFPGDEDVGESIDEFSLGVYSYDLVGATWSIENVLRGGAVPAAETVSLTAASAAGSFVLSVPPTATFPPYGVIYLSEGILEETVRYVRFNAALGEISLATALVNSYTTSAVATEASLPENRMSPNSHVDGTIIRVYNGKSFNGYDSSEVASILDTVVEYDTATGTFDEVLFSPTIPRYRAGSGQIGTDVFVAGGSALKSAWLDEAEFVEETGVVFTGKPTIAEMSLARHSVGAAAASGNLYVIGGAGSGHSPGWLKIEVQASPETVRADGKQTASIVVTAEDASGDPPPDGTMFRAKGLIFLDLNEKEQEAVAAADAEANGAGDAIISADGAGAAEIKPSPQKISILPVLFSSLDMEMEDGEAATTMLARSEDPVTEVEQLFNFVKRGEAVIDQQALKAKFDEQNKRNQTLKVGERRDLYNAAIEVSVVDPFFFGTSSTDAAIANATSRPLADGSGFSFNPPPAQQGLSASVAFYSDISSIPDVQIVATEVDEAEAKAALDSLAEEIPFGASPHFDALVSGANARSLGAPFPTNIMISASDNDQNSSSSTAQDAADEANAVNGEFRFPVFVTSFVVTDPVSLSARRARTDVADLELVSSETGGNSFSVVDSSYVSFVIDRIKTSAPSSIGSGVITATREIVGSLTTVSYVVSNLGPAGNLAEMRVWHSLDGYNYEQIDAVIEPNVSYALDEPIKASYLKYEVRLQSKTYDSPVLSSVTLEYVEPSVQYLYVYPVTIAGQLTEAASVVNHRLPSGGTVEVGVVHGDSLMFDRDYASSAQPATGDRGTIVAINRDDGGTFIGDEPTRDRLESDDFLVYRSKTGPWAQDAITTVYVNNVAVLPTDFIAFEEQGLVAFKKRLSATDVVGLEVQNAQGDFRLGIKITNPTLEEGILDSFAYMYGTTQDGSGNTVNRIPKAVSLFITPSPVIPGGPMNANYTFVDPDGDDEDEDQTEINWFRNGVVVPGLRNKRSVTNADIVSTRSDGKGLISKGQQWFFSVRPSDGSAFGPLAVSHTITVANVPPRASEVKIKSSNADPSKFTSSDTLTASFAYSDGDADAASGTTYVWFSSGNEVKSGTTATLTPEDKDSGERKVLSPGAVITVQVTPSDGTEFGETVTSNPVTIAGTPPKVEDVSLLPTSPTSASNLRITYRFIDKDGLADQSNIAWFKNGSRMASLDDAKTVASALIAPGQQWKAVVTPSNGTADGTAVTSNVVIIKF